MRAASQTALAAAGIGIDDVAHLDLYSCFGSSVSFACDALGLAPDDGRAGLIRCGIRDGGFETAQEKADDEPASEAGHGHDPCATRIAGWRCLHASSI